MAGLLARVVAWQAVGIEGGGRSFGPFRHCQPADRPPRSEGRPGYYFSSEHWAILSSPETPNRCNQGAGERSTTPALSSDEAGGTNPLIEAVKAHLGGPAKRPAAGPRCKKLVFGFEAESAMDRRRWASRPAGNSENETITSPITPAARSIPYRTTAPSV